MLIQSYSGAIEVFPAIPLNWQNASFATLRAEGAFLVDAKRTNGKTSYVKVFSEKGGSTKLLCADLAPDSIASKGAIIKRLDGSMFEITMKKGDIAVFGSPD